jgi:hypothetical protein
MSHAGSHFALALRQRIFILAFCSLSNDTDQLRSISVVEWVYAAREKTPAGLLFLDLDDIFLVKHVRWFASHRAGGDSGPR